MNCKHCGAKIKKVKIDQAPIRNEMIRLVEKNNWSYRGFAMSLNINASVLHKFRYGRGLNESNFNKIRKFIEEES